MVTFAESQDLSTSSRILTQVPRVPQLSGQHVLVLRLSCVLQTAGNCAQAKGSTTSSNKILIVPT